MPPIVAPASKKEVSAEEVVPDEDMLSDGMRMISIKDNLADTNGPTATFSNKKDENVACDNYLNVTVIPANRNVIASKQSRQPMILSPQSQKIYFNNEAPVSMKCGLASEEGDRTYKRDHQLMSLIHHKPDIYSKNGTEEKDFALSINKHRASFTPEGSPSKFDHKRNISDLSTTETLVGNDNENKEKDEKENEDKENEDDLATPTKHTVRIASLQAQLASVTAQLHASEQANAASRTRITTLKAANRRQRLEICNLNRALTDAREKHGSQARTGATLADAPTAHANELASLNATHASVGSPAAARVAESVVARINARLGDILTEVRAGGVGLVPEQEKAVMEPLEGLFETDVGGEATRGVELEGMFGFLAERGRKLRELGMEATEEEVLSAMRCEGERAQVERMEDDVFAAVRSDNGNMRCMRAAER
ncbi:hypothetical protein NpPPO83_00000303 [Neofusicoccum parvum]|uniref:Uncharacterized protein n=1 Tax=Neofusicoccum parvum TaxID=310453 RepID=A0ACB5SD21_9PEZI|nr:hypothetical protein NpPPO83_00000303 [Neofusicoccum parvum]